MLRTAPTPSSRAPGAARRPKTYAQDISYQDVTKIAGRMGHYRNAKTLVGRSGSPGVLKRISLQLHDTSGYSRSHKSLTVHPVYTQPPPVLQCPAPRYMI